MNKLNFFLMSLVLISFSCREERMSKELEEHGKVVSKTYVPGCNYTTSDMSIDAEGNVTWTTNSHWKPPEWTVTFQCEHGQFTVSKPDSGLHDRMNPGEEVFILYQHVYEVEKKDSQEILHHKKYHFLDAGPKSFERPRVE